MKQEVVWVDSKTYLMIMNQLKAYGEIVIEARGYKPMIVVADIKVKKEIKNETV